MRDVDMDGIVDLVDAADRGMGTIVCNVQRYDPTPAEPAATAAIQGQVSSRDVNLPLASPIGLDNSIADCVPFNILGNGQISPEAAAYIMTPKYGIGTVDQDFAELRGGAGLPRADRQPHGVVSLRAVVRPGPGAVHRLGSAQQQLGRGRVDIDDNTIHSKSWTNLVVSYGRDVPTGGAWRLTFNVQNLFDDDPPIIPATGGGRFGAQITSNTYDVWGRRYQLTFNYDL